MYRRILTLGVSVVLFLAACTTTTDGTTTTETSPTLPRSTSTIPPPQTTAPRNTTSTATTVFVPTDTDLLVVGDWGSGTLPQGAVAGAMDRYAVENEVEAILTTGDNFYSDNIDFLMQPYGWARERNLPWWITWGNHDVESDSRIAAVNQTFDSPPRWSIHEWGAVDVVTLDSNQITNLQQAAFFLSAMADSDRPMIIALHHPPYSCSHHGSTTAIVNSWVGLLDDDVVLVLSGHDHSYQRFENVGITYVVTGGGGRALRPLTDCPDNHPDRLAGAELFHFVALEQTSNSIELKAIDVNGDPIDEVSIPLP